MKLELVQISTGNQLRERMENQTISIFSHVQNQLSNGHLYFQFQKFRWKNQRRRRWFFLQQGGGAQAAARNAPRPASISFLKHKIAPFTVQLHFTHTITYHPRKHNQHLTSFENRQDNRIYKIPYNAFPFYNTCYLLSLYTYILFTYITHYVFNI